MKKGVTVYQILIGIVVAIIFTLFILTFTKGGVEYEIEPETLESLTPAEKAELQNYKKYTFKYTYIIESTGYVPKFSFKLPLPVTEEGKQYITERKLSIKPARVYKSEENEVAEILLKDLHEGQTQISISGVAKVRTYNLLNAQMLKLPFKPEKYINRYLKEEKNIEISSPIVQKIANSISGNTQEELVDNIYNYVTSKTQYTQFVGKPSAELTLKTKRGKCIDLSLAMVALCRAKGIPARIVSGNIAREFDPNHTWVEVYLDKYGWVSYDPTIQLAYVNYYKNGMFEKRVQHKTRPKLRYIISYRNAYSPWFINYETEDADIDKLYIFSKTEIKEIK